MSTLKRTRSQNLDKSESQCEHRDETTCRSLSEESFGLTFNYTQIEEYNEELDTIQYDTSLMNKFRTNLLEYYRIQTELSTFGLQNHHQFPFEIQHSQSFYSDLEDLDYMSDDISLKLDRFYNLKSELISFARMIFRLITILTLIP